jgi:hypothetical protein
MSSTDYIFNKFLLFEFNIKFEIEDVVSLLFVFDG